MAGTAAKTAAKLRSVKPVAEQQPGAMTVSKADYDTELLRLQTELVRKREWVVHKGRRVLVFFEGRDTS